MWRHRILIGFSLLAVPSAAQGVSISLLGQNEFSPEEVDNTGFLNIFVDPGDVGYDFANGGIGLSLESSHPGVLEFRDAEVFRPTYMNGLMERWNGSSVVGLHENSIDQLMGISVGTAGLAGEPDGPSAGGPAGSYFFGQIQYEVVGAGGTNISLGPMTSRSGVWLVNRGKDVTNEINFFGLDCPSCTPVPPRPTGEDPPQAISDPIAPEPPPAPTLVDTPPDPEIIREEIPAPTPVPPSYPADEIDTISQPLSETQDEDAALAPNLIQEDIETILWVDSSVPELSDHKSGLQSCLTEVLLKAGAIQRTPGLGIPLSIPLGKERVAPTSISDPVLFKGILQTSISSIAENTALIPEPHSLALLGIATLLIPSLNRRRVHGTFV